MTRDPGIERLVDQGCLTRSRSACVIGSGPNGLAAAIVLAQAGMHVDVFEAEAIPGGAVRTLELTLPGFLHDFGADVHPLEVGSHLFYVLLLCDYKHVCCIYSSAFAFK